MTATRGFVRSRWTMTSWPWFEYAGTSLAAGHLDSDGIPDLAVMSTLYTGPNGVGRVRVFPGIDHPTEPLAIGLPGDRTRAFSDTLCGLITAHLGVAPDRIYIEFSDAARHLWGWNSGTF